MQSLQKSSLVRVVTFRALSSVGIRHKVHGSRLKSTLVLSRQLNFGFFLDSPTLVISRHLNSGSF